MKEVKKNEATESQAVSYFKMIAPKYKYVYHY